MAAMVGVTLHNDNSTDIMKALHWPFIPVLSALLAWFGWWQLPDAAVVDAAPPDQVLMVAEIDREHILITAD
jgi:hypothetical protein